jgi:hypothetical protein
MSAAFYTACRAALAEVARGVSTGLVVWGACPAPRCECHCEALVCPTWHCSGTSVFPTPYGLLFTVALISFVAGTCIGWALRNGDATGSSATPRHPALVSAPRRAALAESGSGGLRGLVVHRAGARPSLADGLAEEDRLGSGH